MSELLTLNKKTQDKLDIMMAVALIKGLYNQNKISEAEYLRIQKQAEADIEKLDQK